MCFLLIKVVLCLFCADCLSDLTFCSANCFWDCFQFIIVFLVCLCVVLISALFP